MEVTSYWGAGELVNERFVDMLKLKNWWTWLPILHRSRGRPTLDWEGKLASSARTDLPSLHKKHLYKHRETSVLRRAPGDRDTVVAEAHCAAVAGL